MSSLHEYVLARGAQVAFIESEMVALDDAETLRLLKMIAERTRVVLFGVIENARKQKMALEAGVRGILNRRHSARYVRRAILKVADGGIWLEPLAAESLLHHVFSAAVQEDEESRRIREVTRREHKVIELVCRGLRNKQIAAELGISETTVCHHLTSVFAKLGVSDRVALVTFAYRHAMHVPVPVERTHWRRSNEHANQLPALATKIAC